MARNIIPPALNATEENLLLARGFREAIIAFLRGPQPASITEQIEYDAKVLALGLYRIDIAREIARSSVEDVWRLWPDQVLAWAEKGRS